MTKDKPAELVIESRSGDTTAHIVIVQTPVGPKAQCTILDRRGRTNG